MKNFSSILNLIKLVIKYSAYVIVFVDILTYAMTKIEELTSEINKDVKKHSSFSEVSTKIEQEKNNETNSTSD